MEMCRPRYHQRTAGRLSDKGVKFTFFQMSSGLSKLKVCQNLIFLVDRFDIRQRDMTKTGVRALTADGHLWTFSL